MAGLINHTKKISESNRIDSEIFLIIYDFAKA